MIASMLVLNHSDVIALKITDHYSVHRIVYDLFEDVRSDSQKCASVPSGLLYVDKGGEINNRQILILSNRPPKIPTYGFIKSHSIPEVFLSHDRYRFEVNINPTRRESKTGKTVAVCGREAIAEWFTGKAPSSWGFSVKTENFRIETLNVKKFKKSQVWVTLASATLIGELLVTDREKFVKSFKDGIGRGRAFGFGLLQIVPLQY